MTQVAPQRPAEAPADARCYARDTVEFGRVVNLADAVFAIALTLLVLNLDAPDVARGELAGALARQVPQLVTFGLAFLLIANVWRLHHRIFAALAWVEPGLIGLNLAVLAGVALVPFPTSLVGAAPNSRAAVLPFIGVFAAISALCWALILRARRLRAWRRPLPETLFRWVRADWLANIGVHGACLVVAVWAPLAGLGLLAVTSMVVGLAMGHLAPAVRRDWF